MKTNESPEEVQEATEVQAPKGRAAFLAKIQEKEPDYNPENDDELWDRVHGMHNEASGELEKHRGSNARLAELIAKDPRMGATLGMVAGEGKSFPYSVAKVYGKEPFELEGDDLEEFEKGYQEQLAEMGASKSAQEEAQKNIQAYFEALDAYCKDRSEEEKNALNDKIYAMADNFLNGIISPETIELVDKGLNYDQDVQDAADTGKVEGLNQKIETKLKKSEGEIPDLGSATKGGSKTPRPAKTPSFYSKL